MTILAQKSSIKTIRHGDKKFMITDSVIVSPRAGFEISCRCPQEYKWIINECVTHGWIKPVAYMKEEEFMWETLNED